jgi:hypothetical protein
MNTLKFQNTDFKTREIELPDLGNVLISTSSLNNALMNNGSDYVSEEAKNIDEEIYFFVEDDEIELNEEDLIKIVSSQVV